MVGPTWVSLRRGSLLLRGAGSGESESSGILMLISLSMGEGLINLSIESVYCAASPDAAAGVPRPVFRELGNTDWTWRI